MYRASTLPSQGPGHRTHYASTSCNLESETARPNRNKWIRRRYSSLQLLRVVLLALVFFLMVGSALAKEFGASDLAGYWGGSLIETRSDGSVYFGTLTIDVTANGTISSGFLMYTGEPQPYGGPRGNIAVSDSGGVACSFTRTLAPLLDTWTYNATHARLSTGGNVVAMLYRMEGMHDLQAWGRAILVKKVEETVPRTLDGIWVGRHVEEWGVPPNQNLVVGHDRITPSTHQGEFFFPQPDLFTLSGDYIDPTAEIDELELVVLQAERSGIYASHPIYASSLNMGDPETIFVGRYLAGEATQYAGVYLSSRYDPPYDLQELEGTWEAFSFETDRNATNRPVFSRLSINSQGNVLGGAYEYIHAPVPVKGTIDAGQMTMDGEGFFNGWYETASNVNATAWNGLLIPDRQAAALTVTNSMGLYNDAFLIKVPEPANATLVFPHVDTSGHWETEICIISNENSTDIRGHLNAFNATGAPVTDALPVTLPPLGRVYPEVGELYHPVNHEDIAYITFTYAPASHSVVGYTKFTSNGRIRGALPAVSERASGDLPIPHIASNQNWWTGIGLVNLDAQDKELTVRFSGNNTKTVTIPAGGQSSFLVRNLFDNVPQEDITSAVLENASGLVGLELFGQNNQMGGIRLSDATSTTLCFPHVHSDASWWTGLVVYNPQPAALAFLTVTAYSASGEQLASQDIPLYPQSKYVGLVRDLGLPEDTAWIKVVSTQPVTGFELFGTFDAKLLAGFNTVELGRTRGVFPKLDQDGWTGLSFVNTTDAPITVTLTAHRNDGSMVGSASIGLAGHAKSLGFAPDIFGDDDILEAVYIRFTATGPVAGFQLNGSNDGWLLDGLPGM